MEKCLRQQHALTEAYNYLTSWEAFQRFVYLKPSQQEAEASCFHSWPDVIRRWKSRVKCSRFIRLQQSTGTYNLVAVEIVNPAWEVGYLMFVNDNRRGSAPSGLHVWSSIVVVIMGDSSLFYWTDIICFGRVNLVPAAVVCVGLLEYISLTVPNSSCKTS